MDLEVFKGKTDVFVGTLRGRKDPWQWATGVGGVATEDLVKIDISTHGTTWLWEPLAMFLEVLRTEIINAAKPPSARLLLLDLSGSMRDNQDLLKKMWAAVPRNGLAVDGVEIMVVTDGEDTDSNRLVSYIIDTRIPVHYIFKFDITMDNTFRVNIH